MVVAPHITHQVFIVDGLELPHSIPPLIQGNIDSVRRVYHDCDHVLWSGAALRDFIRCQYGDVVLDAFDMLRPYSYKSDLARFCLLHHFGGVYVDLGVRVLNAISPPPHVGLASFRDVDFGSPCWTAVNGGLIWAKPGRDEFEIAIKLVVENCGTKFYGANWLYPTGPVLLGRALITAKAMRQMSDDADDQWIGAFRAVTPEAHPPNLAYITPDYTLVALRNKKYGADLTHLGAAGVNNYAEIWKSRQVYGEVERIWRFNDQNIRPSAGAVRENNGISIKPDYRGIVTFGPYVQAEAGKYIFRVIFDRVTILPNFGQDVLHEPGIIVVEKTHLSDSVEKDELSIDFVLEHDIKQLELRTHCFGPLNCKISRIVLERI